MRSRPDLIVPIRDRRQHKRILTLKNFGKVALGIAIFFLGVTIRSDLRRSPSGDYGRLFGKQVSGQTSVQPKRVDVVREAPVVDQTAADPWLLAPAAREQYLGVNLSVQPTASQVPPAQAAPGEAAVVNGPNGVTIVRGEATKQPTLSGGVFRQ